MIGRRGGLANLVLVFLGLSLTTCAQGPGLNIVVITIDTLRADHLGCYGYPRPTSPRLDAFAADNVMFENVACQSSQTLPSHASIFTGLNPRNHKAISHESPLPEEAVTLAEILKHRGYETGAFVSSHALDSDLHLTQGFDTYWEIHKELSQSVRRALHVEERDPTTEAALAWLEDHAGSRFFLWIHWFHPHRPYNPPQTYLQRFAPEYSGEASSEPEYVMKAWKGEIEIDRQDIDYLTGCYDGEVAYSDFQIGRLIDALDSLGLTANTVIVVTADHGEILYEHERYFGHDIALYDECLMVPLVVHVPGTQPTRRRVSELTQSIDILPTLLELLEIEYPQGLEGKSLLGLMSGGTDATGEHAFSETFPFPEKCMPRHAVRTASSKLIWKENPSGPLIKEFYDLATDPGEKIDLFGQSNEAARLDSVLMRWIAPAGLHPGPIPTAAESRRWGILKSLGYVN